MSFSVLSLTLEVISLLRPLRSVVRISRPPDSLHTQVHLELGAKDNLGKLCRQVRHRSFGTGRLVTTHSHRVLSHLGALLSLDSLIQHRVLFLRWGQTYPDLGTQDKDPIPLRECLSGVMLSTINGTPDKLLCLSPQDRHGIILPKVHKTR